jgi:hypothetical protein
MAGAGRCTARASCPGRVFGLDVGVEVVPDQDDLPAGKLPVHGGDQVPVFGLGERLSLAPAAVVLMITADQPGVEPGR